MLGRRVTSREGAGGAGAPTEGAADRTWPLFDVRSLGPRIPLRLRPSVPGDGPADRGLRHIDITVSCGLTRTGLVLVDHPLAGDLGRGIRRDRSLRPCVVRLVDRLR